MKTPAAFLAVLVLLHPAIGGTVTQGPPITAADLARQLGVFSTSLTYEQEQPFNALHFSLTYKERMPDGTYVVKAELASSTHPIPIPTTHTAVTVFVDKTKSMVISAACSSAGKGFNVGTAYSTLNPPPLRKGGGYILLTTVLDSRKPNSEANIKGIIELTLEGFAEDSASASPEKTLADLQVEEIDLKSRYADANPLLRGVRAQIAAAESVPQIKNEKYRAALQDRLADLKVTRMELTSRYRDGSPQIARLDAQIAFIEKALEPGENDGPQTSR